MCVGGKTYIQIYVYAHHQTSPLPLLHLHVRLPQSLIWGLAAKGRGYPSSPSSCGVVWLVVGWE